MSEQKDDFETAPFPEDEPKHVLPPLGFTEVPFIEPEAPKSEAAEADPSAGYTKVPEYDGKRLSTVHIPFPQEAPHVVPPSGFPELAFNDENEPMALESLCMNCFKNGTTRLLPTMIPYFREVVICSFYCPHCEYRNNEMQPAGEIQEQGVRMELQVSTHEDLNRQAIKSATAVVLIPELEFEFPTGKAELSTIEGFLTSAAENLEADQIIRETLQPDMHAKVASVITSLRSWANGGAPFTFIVDDPSGNSSIQPLCIKDPKIKEAHYRRSQQQDIDIGLSGTDDNVEAMTNKGKIGAVTCDAPTSLLETFVTSTEKEVYTLPSVCVECRQPGENRMYVCDVPHFKDLIVMNFSCEECGYRSTEVKPGGGIGEKGKRMSLRVLTKLDLDRFVLKSDTCLLSIPELELELVSGSMGAVFTTLEGLLDKLIEQLKRTNPFAWGDSIDFDKTDADAGMRGTYMKIISTVEEYKQGESLPFTIILDDPLGNTYIEQKGRGDTQVTNDNYERTWEQNEEYGINDMHLEGGEEEEEEEEGEGEEKTEEAATETAK